MSETNCPNCGAPIEGHYCMYCGTPTYTAEQAVAGATGRVCHCWYEVDGHKHCFDMFVNRIEISPFVSTLYSFDGEPCMSVVDKVDIDIDATMLDFDERAWREHLKDWSV